MTETRGEPIIDSLTRSAADGAYHCPACDSPFTRRSNLRRHYAIHTRGTGYQCQICNRFFARSDQLRTHIVRCEAQNGTSSGENSAQHSRRTSSLEPPNSYDPALSPVSASSSGLYPPHTGVHSNFERGSMPEYGYLPPFLSLASGLESDAAASSYSYRHTPSMYPHHPSSSSYHAPSYHGSASYQGSSSYTPSSSYYPSPPSTGYSMSHSTDGGPDRGARVGRPASTSYPVPRRRGGDGSSGPSSPRARGFTVSEMPMYSRRTGDSFADGVSHGLSGAYDNVYQTQQPSAAFGLDGLGVGSRSGVSSSGL